MSLDHQKASNRILIVDDEASLRTVLSALLRQEGFLTETAENGQQALQMLKDSQMSTSKEPFDVVIADLRMPEMDGMQLLQHIVQDYSDLPVVMLTAHGTVDTAVQALKQGAFDFLTKPYERGEFLVVLRKAIAHRETQMGKNFPQADVEKIEELLVGQSAAMQKLRDTIQQVASTPSTVLITGESGTGKELVAQSLHQHSTRARGPFIRINCAAIPADLLESELFGYEQGAFVGAVTTKPGRLELAQTGTLLLDEIEEMSTKVQAKLLRVLQESSFERVGGIESIQMDTRVIACMSKDPRKAIAEGSLREDLYYRLNVVPISLPPLRQHMQDISPLVQHFVDKYNRKLGKSIEGFSPQALELLQLYNWPGNVRELENIVERTLLFAQSNCIEKEDIPPDVAMQIAANQSLQMGGKSSLSMKDVVRKRTAELEHDLIEVALKENRGNVTHTARKLKISRKSLQLKMKELGLRDQS